MKQSVYKRMTVPLFIRTNKRDIMTPIKPTLDWQLKSETIPCMVIKSAFKAYS